MNCLSLLVEMVAMLSQLITESWSIPLRGPTGTSVVIPRTREVIGAIVTLVNRGRTASLVKTTTGRSFPPTSAT